jgi:hypothetical protein
MVASMVQAVTLVRSGAGGRALVVHGSYLWHGHEGGDMRERKNETSSQIKAYENYLIFFLSMETN